MSEILFGVPAFLFESLPWFLIQVVIWRVAINNRIEYEENYAWLKRVGWLLPLAAAVIFTLRYLWGLQPGKGWDDVLRHTLYSVWLVILAWLGLKASVCGRRLD